MQKLTPKDMGLDFKEPAFTSGKYDMLFFEDAVYLILDSPKGQSSMFFLMMKEALVPVSFGEATDLMKKLTKLPEVHSDSTEVDG